MADEETNFYNPGGEAPGKPAEDPKSTKGIAWSASEYIDHQRGASWYVSLVAATVALAVVIYFLTKDYFATGTIGVLGIIVGFFVGHKPGQIQFELTDSGLQVGPKAYGYGLFKSFSIIKEDNLISLNLTPAKRFMPPVSAYFDPKDEKKITNLIGNHLPYEERKLGAFDRLSTRLKL